jgi:hypothetical protein
VLRWVRRCTLTMAAWEDAEQVEKVLGALATKLDGKPVAASSVKRHRRVLSVVMAYAIKRGILLANPLPKGKGNSGPKTYSGGQAVSDQSAPGRATAGLDPSAPARRETASCLLRNDVLRRGPPGRSRGHGRGGHDPS